MAEDERHQRDDEARHAPDHVARMIEPRPIRQMRAKRQTDEGRDKGCDEEGESETERCRGHGLGFIGNERCLPARRWLGKRVNRRIKPVAIKSGTVSASQTRHSRACWQARQSR
jgi:hypothetical protein